jgi:hypothetical protein
VIRNALFGQGAQLLAPIVSQANVRCITFPRSVSYPLRSLTPFLPRTYTET